MNTEAAFYDNRPGRYLWLLCALMLSMTSPVALALCSDAQQTNANRVAMDAYAATDNYDRVIMLKRSLQVCPDYAVWLELGKTEIALDNPIGAAYALENARDFYTADENNTLSSDQILRQAIANSWLAETYLRDDELALATVATQEATAAFELLGQSVPDRLIELQAEIDDSLASADAAVIARSLSLQHNRGTRGIGVRSRIGTEIESAESESAESQAETSQLLAEYSGETAPLATVETAVAAPAPDTVPVATAATESRLNIPVLFEFDSDQLSAASIRTVAQLAAAIQALNLQENDSVLIVGHTDSQGSEAYNLALSKRRAESVLQQIRQITDIDAQLLATGKGEEELRYRGNNRDDHRRNRRVEMVIRR